MKRFLFLSSTLFLSLLFSPANSFAQNAKPAETPQTLSLASPIGDHMVLQQGRATSIWGKAKPNSEITVSFAGAEKTTTANDKGDWQVKIGKQKTNKTPQTLTISSGSDEKIKVKDILVGEVWMCSGQSNMAWTVSKSHNAEEAAAAANHPNVRLFTTEKQTAASPKTDLSGEWKICSPETAPSFSAVSYFFGKELAKNLDVPIGLIATPWGGKPSEAFTSREKLEATPAAKRLVAEWDAKQAAYDPDKAKTNYEKALAAWEVKVKKLREESKEKNQKPRLPRRPAAPSAPNLASNAPSAIYNQMVAPWTRYAIAGAIWYQGESNRTRAVQYETIFPAMIEDWREKWGYDFSFYFVQLANFQKPSSEPGVPDSWAELQNAQTLTLQKVPNTGMAIINDIGEANDIHPGNKEDVGKRLSLWALSQHYGKEIDPWSGPIYKKQESVDGGKVRVHFDHVGKGLKSRDGGKLQRFEIAGEDKKFVWAEANIEEGGKTVLVSSESVPKPASVRYAWAANPEGANLVNSAGLPASLFRTDDWPLSSARIETLADAFARQRVKNIDATNEKLAAAGWEILFNGKDLSGWKNPFKYGEAKVVNGEIHLLADKKFFLVTEKKYGDFQLVAEIHLPEGKANSGIMFRCHVEPGKVYGYQAECDGSDRRWSGGLYDEGRRQWIWPFSEGRSEEKFRAHKEKSLAHFAKPEVRNALKRNDWNRYNIRCVGDRISISVNGVSTTNIRDDMDAEGYIGIQHHGEKGQTYRFRNIYLRPVE